MSKTNEPIPDPIAGKHFSDQFIVRVPPEANRKLAIQAAESGVSFHRIVVVGAKLSRLMDLHTTLPFTRSAAQNVMR